MSYYVKQLYEKSILVLSKLDKEPTPKEWNIIATQKNLLSRKAMQGYARKNFREIYRESRRKLKDELFEKLINSNNEEDI